MFKIGTHLSVAKGFLSMGRDACSIGANTFQFFMRNPRGAKARAFDENDVSALGELLKEQGFAPSGSSRALYAESLFRGTPCAGTGRRIS